MISRRILGTLTGAAALLMAGTATAGTPLPDPPFSDGGFVAPDKDALKGEAGVGGLFTKYAGGISKCQQKALGAIFQAAGDGLKLADAAFKLNACTAKADTKLTDGYGKLVAKGIVPACLQANFATVKGGLDTQIGLLGPIAGCDGTVDPGTGLRVATSKDFLKGELGVSSAALKAGAATGKCFEKTGGAVFKAAGDGVKIADAVAKHAACTAKAAAKGAASVQKLSDKALLPACLPLATAQGVVSSAIALGGQFTAEVECASPSGAFVDGTATF